VCEDNLELKASGPVASDATDSVTSSGSHLPVIGTIETNHRTHHYYCCCHSHRSVLRLRCTLQTPLYHWFIIAVSTGTGRCRRKSATMSESQLHDARSKAHPWPCNATSSISQTCPTAAPMQSSTGGCGGRDMTGQTQSQWMAASNLSGVMLYCPENFYVTSLPLLVVHVGWGVQTR